MNIEDAHEEAVKFRRRAITQKTMDEFIGICEGIIADRVVNETEADFLRKWMKAQQDYLDLRIVGDLFNKIESALKDNTLTSEESKDLEESLEKFTEIMKDPEDKEEGRRSSSLMLDQPPPPIKFKDSVFCITGTLRHGVKRKDLALEIVKAGGIIADRVSSRTDYLVVGSMASEAWKHSPYGNKIIHAVELREKGSLIAIVSEDHLREQMLSSAN